MSDAVSVVWDDALLGYTMGGDHPLHPVRLDLTMRLADSLGVLATDRLRVVAPVASALAACMWSNTGLSGVLSPYPVKNGSSGATRTASR